MSSQTCHDFEISDAVGRTSEIIFHPIKSISAYELGGSIVLWHLEEDKKIKIHNHLSSPVQSILFCGNNYQYVLSLDSGPVVSLIITEWETLRRIHNFHLPRGRKKGVSKKIVSSDYLKSMDLISVCESDTSEGGYRITLWELKSEKISLIFLSDVEQSAVSFRICFFPHKMTYIQMATYESQCVKFWRYIDEKIILVNRIHMKEPIIDSTLNKVNSMVYLLSRTGKLFIVNDEGQLLSTLTSPKVFSCLNQTMDHLYVGTLKGDVEIFNVNSLLFIRGIPYQDLYKSGIKQTSLQLQQDIKTLDFKDHIPAVSSICASDANSTLIINYADGSLVVFDLTKSMVYNGFFGHLQRINNLAWISGAFERLITSSDDGTLMFWEYRSDCWIGSKVDLAKTIDRKIGSYVSAQRSFPETTRDAQSIIPRNHSLLKVKNIACHPKKPQVFCTDNKGFLYVFSSANGQIENKQQITRGKIKHMELDPDGIYMSVNLGDGLVLVLDTGDNNSVCTTLEERISEHLLSKKQLRRCRVLRPLSSIKTEAMNWKMEQEKAELMVVTVKNQNTLRLHHVQKQGMHKFNSFVVSSFYLEGKAIDFCVHTSREYLLAITSSSLFYVFKLMNGEIRGKISIPTSPKMIAVDPSGLYAAIGFSETLEEKLKKNTLDLDSKSIKTLNTEIDDRENELSRIDNRQGCNKIQVYEVGTGCVHSKIESFLGVTSVQFSKEGNFLAAGNDSGILYIWRTGGDLREDIIYVLDSMKKKPDFWSDFSIFIKDGEQEQRQYKANDSLLDLPSPLLLNEKANSNSNFPKSGNIDDYLSLETSQGPDDSKYFPQTHTAEEKFVRKRAVGVPQSLLKPKEEEKISPDRQGIIRPVPFFSGGFAQQAESSINQRTKNPEPPDIDADM